MREFEDKPLTVSFGVDDVYVDGDEFVMEFSWGETSRTKLTEEERVRLLGVWGGPEDDG